MVSMRVILMLPLLVVVVLVVVLSVVVWLHHDDAGLVDAAEEAADAVPAASVAPAGPATWVGSASCRECHEPEHQDWLGSHHQLAMQRATPASVLADVTQPFTDRAGTTTRFRWEGDDLVVQTDDAAGEVGDFPVPYVFGLTPLQQYLVPTGRGHIQCLGVAWHSTPAEAGGQHWFHLYPDEAVDHEHIFHWTGRYQNWNFMCAECHSTDLRKGYDAETQTYRTTWREISVGCEACHGPGSHHVAWAEKRWPQDDPLTGLVFPLGGARLDGWVIDPETGTASHPSPARNRREINLCARCHSRRTQIYEDFQWGEDIGQSHRLSLLQEPLYYPDGQIRDEVYVVGSFLQSKMYQKGVTCSDCHEPHLAQAYTTSNELCARCHEPAVFDREAHHFHPAGSALCVDCHMPETTYMVVDPRRDHRFGIPRPDLSERFGVPNACTGCHEEYSNAEAAAICAEHYGAPEEDRYTRALAAQREGRQETRAWLREALAEPEQAPIKRATLLQQLAQEEGGVDARLLRAHGQEADPLVRWAVAQAGAALPPADQLATIGPLLSDTVRSVRIEALRCLAPHARNLPSTWRAAYRAAREDFLHEARLNADRPEARVNFANLLLAEGALAEAERELRAALELDPRFVGARINLADLLRRQGDEAACAALLRAGLRGEHEPALLASLHHALGLSLIRQGDKAQALDQLAQGHQLAPDHPRHAYVYAVALDDAGRRAEAIALLQDLLARRPHQAELRQLLTHWGGTPLVPPPAE